MRDLELLNRKAAQMERALSRMRSKLPATPTKLVTDYDAQDIVYRNFEIAVQNGVDMGSHLISVERWETPKTMGDVFDLLRMHGVISLKMAREWRALVTVRNILVHDYTRVDHRKAYRVVRQSLRMMPQFCLCVLRVKRSRSRS